MARVWLQIRGGKGCGNRAKGVEEPLRGGGGAQARARTASALRAAGELGHRWDAGGCHDLVQHWSKQPQVEEGVLVHHLVARARGVVHAAD